MNSALSIKELQGCRRLFLKNYDILINIGVHDFEKKAEQHVIVNIDLYVPLDHNTPKSDDLSEVVDYDFMREILKKMLAHPLVKAARVSTEKPDVYPDCDGVGVEVFEIKQD